jgi:hypothetical protein
VNDDKEKARQAAREKRELDTFRFLCVEMAKALAPFGSGPLDKQMSATQIADKAIDIVSQIWDKTEPA